VVDKTATYVHKKGRVFEEMIMKVEAMNPKFNFLRHEDDPYRPYYMQKLEELAGGLKPDEGKDG
jgi:Surp module